MESIQSGLARTNVDTSRSVVKRTVLEIDHWSARLDNWFTDYDNLREFDYNQWIDDDDDENDDDDVDDSDE